MATACFHVNSTVRSSIFDHSLGNPPVQRLMPHCSGRHTRLVVLRSKNFHVRFRTATDRGLSDRNYRTIWFDFDCRYFATSYALCRRFSLFVFDCHFAIVRVVVALPTLDWIINPCGLFRISNVRLTGLISNLWSMTCNWIDNNLSGGRQLRLITDHRLQPYNRSMTCQWPITYYPPQLAIE